MQTVEKARELNSSNAAHFGGSIRNIDTGDIITDFEGKLIFWTDDLETFESETWIDEYGQRNWIFNGTFKPY